MTLSEINIFIANSNSEDELLAINARLIVRIKQLRSIKARSVAASLFVGQTVTWSGRKGTFTGELVKINRKNAKIKVGITTWTVPMNMLSAA